MKRLAIFIGGLFVLPAFAEVAPVFVTDEGALEYADLMYDENGFLIIPDTEIVEETDEVDEQKSQTPVKISRVPTGATPTANRSTASRAVPASGRTNNTSGRGSNAGNSSRVVSARTTTATPRANASRTVASRGTVASPRTGTAATTSTRTTSNTAATNAAAARATGGSARSTATTGANVARTGTVARTATTTRAGTARAATAKSSTVSRAATTDTSRPSVRGNIDVGAGVKAGATITASNGTVTLVDSNRSLYNASAVRRAPTVRMSALKDTTESTITMSMEDMDDLAEMTDYCKAQYASCMDNYCNVLDDNQGRCSCSANLKNYAKAEQALKTATEELQDVAQKIQYIGLTTREVETLFTQTEAELAMQSKTDTSQLQASLDKIKDMIIDVKTGNTTSSGNTDLFGLNFDLSGLLEFSFDSTGFDLGSLFGMSNTNSVSNQRGEELFKTATARCKTSVLKACTARGVDASLVTNAYDLEIDRECIAYERSLNDSNDQMIATVRNAKNVLQKARLMVAQQKNAYDLRGCINALDECMQDEFVCGSEYENCLDPTGRYIVNGEIVVGSQPGHAIDPDLPQNVASVMTSDVCRVNLYRTWDVEPGVCTPHTVDDAYSTYVQYPTADQGNAWGSGNENDNLVYYIEQTVKTGAAHTASENMSKYLQNKIGYIDKKDGRAHGMCISVLNKCQDYSYDGKGTSASYKEDNDVIKQYLGRVLVQIKAKQDEILANYAETCVTDVTSCLSQNGYPTEDPTEWGDGDPNSLEYTQNIVKQNIAVNACRAQVVTCMSVNGYSISTPTPTEMNCWVQGLLYNYTTEDCMFETNTTHSCSSSTPGWCYNKTACEDVGANWCGSSCQQQECSCSTQNPGSCTETECKAKTGLFWCTNNGGSCMTSNSQCRYTVNIACGSGSTAASSNPTSSNVMHGNSVQLNNAWCNASSDYTFIGWTCTGGSVDSSGKYYPTHTGTTCTANFRYVSPDTPKYSVTLNCGNSCTYNSRGYSGTSLPQGTSLTVPTCNNAVNETVEWSCQSDSTITAGQINGGNSLSVTGKVNCTAQCSTPGTGDEISVCIDCGINTFVSDKINTISVGSKASASLPYTETSSSVTLSSFTSGDGIEFDKGICKCSDGSSPTGWWANDSTQGISVGSDGKITMSNITADTTFTPICSTGTTDGTTIVQISCPASSWATLNTNFFSNYPGDIIAGNVYKQENVTSSTFALDKDMCACKSGDTIKNWINSNGGLVGGVSGDYGTTNAILKTGQLNTFMPYCPSDWVTLNLNYNNGSTSQGHLYIDRNRTCPNFYTSNSITQLQYCPSIVPDSKITVPTKDNCTFGGFKDSSNNTWINTEGKIQLSVLNYAIPSTGNSITLTAQWDCGSRPVYIPVDVEGD